jgi:hypothetical protein
MGHPRGLTAVNDTQQKIFHSENAGSPYRARPNSAGGDPVGNMPKALDDAAFREIERLGRNDEAAN